MIERNCRKRVIHQMLEDRKVTTSSLRVPMVKFTTGTYGHNFVLVLFMLQELIIFIQYDIHNFCYQQMRCLYTLKVILCIFK